MMNTLNRMSKTPPSDPVESVKPDGMNKSQPPANAQKLIVGAMPPNHVAPSVNEPD